MPSVNEQRKWILQLILSAGVENTMAKQGIRERAGNFYDVNTEIALTELIDAGILIRVESAGEEWYHVNRDRLEEIKDEINANPNPPNFQTDSVIQPYYPEPKDYSFWFEVENTRQFKKQSTYRIFRKLTDPNDFFAQVVSIRKIVPIRMGSLSSPESVISRLWRVIPNIVAEKKGGIFVLQDVQNKDIQACGNSRQRGKVALKIFNKLGYICEVGQKGNSTLYSIGIKRPFNKTIDDYIQPPFDNMISSVDLSDPENYYEEKRESKSEIKRKAVTR